MGRDTPGESRAGAAELPVGGDLETDGVLRTATYSVRHGGWRGKHHLREGFREAASLRTSLCYLFLKPALRPGSGASSEKFCW